MAAGSCVILGSDNRILMQPFEENFPLVCTLRTFICKDILLYVLGPCLTACQCWSQSVHFIQILIVSIIVQYAGIQLAPYGFRSVSASLLHAGDLFGIIVEYNMGIYQKTVFYTSGDLTNQNQSDSHSCSCITSAGKCSYYSDQLEWLSSSHRVHYHLQSRQLSPFSYLSTLPQHNYCNLHSGQPITHQSVWEPCGLSGQQLFLTSTTEEENFRHTCIQSQ